jgi:phosphatidylglycerophosphate synthase
MPDHVTVLAMLAGVAFAPAWLFGFPWLALALLSLHVVLDGLDGPLARHQAVASPRGSFTDTFCDQIVLTTVTISLMIGSDRMLGIVPGAVFLVLYTAVVAVAMVRNALNIPYRWLIRPRFFLYAAIPVELLGVPDAAGAVVWVSIALLAIKILSGFFRLRNQLPGPSNGPQGARAG